MKRTTLEVYGMSVTEEGRPDFLTVEAKGGLDPALWVLKLSRQSLPDTISVKSIAAIKELRTAIDDILDYAKMYLPPKSV